MLQGFGEGTLLRKDGVTLRLFDTVVPLFCHFKTAQGCQLSSVFVQ